MHPALPYLVELQQVDLRLADVRAKLAAAPKRLADADARLEGARGQLAAAKNALTQSLKDRKTFEMDVDSWKEKVRKYKDQSGAVKTNEAYKALLHEIEMAEAQVGQAEDRLLDRMVAGEEYDRQAKAAEVSLKEVEAAVKTDRVAIEAQKSGLEKELAGLTAAREEAAGHVPGDLLEIYARIARKHHATALAALRGESCGQCGMQVRPHVVQEMRKSAGEEIFRCEGCTRILYVAGAAAAPAPAAAAANHSASN